MLLGVLLIQPVISQNLNQFTFRDFDEQLVSIWLDAYRGNTANVEHEMEEASEAWMQIREQILESNILHFAAPTFTMQQDLLMHEMRSAVSNRDFTYFDLMCYEFLAGFREVRTYFTNDLYPLDDLFKSYDIYQELHYAVDDPMLGLYEWKEFVGLFEDFQWQFERYCIMAEPGFDAEESVLFRLMTQRVRDCSEEFSNSLKTAMQNNFVAPCDDTQDALVDLIGLYATEARAPQ